MNPRAFALGALGVIAALCALTVWVVSTVDPYVPQVARTPAPSALPACAAIEVVQGADSIVYEVRRARGQRCRVTLPEGARHARATR